MAINGIKTGDCDSAIVASVNLITTPEQRLATSKAGVISPTSTCTFDASADGYGRAEGANALYIKRMSSAIKARDSIIAVIRGTAVNAYVCRVKAASRDKLLTEIGSNGRTPGLTQPSTDLQEVVIRKAYSRAKLDMRHTDYFECHGTGTPVGDPIEVNAIGRCFARRQGSPLLIGSVSIRFFFKPFRLPPMYVSDFIMMEGALVILKSATIKFRSVVTLRRKLLSILRQKN